MPRKSKNPKEEKPKQENSEAPKESKVAPPAPPKEENEEKPKDQKCQVLDQHFRVVREYSLAIHGEEYEAKAKEFAKSQMAKNPKLAYVTRLVE